MSECPECGCKDAYVGFSSVECTTWGCEHYNVEWLKEVVAKQRDEALQEPPFIQVGMVLRPMGEVGGPVLPKMMEDAGRIFRYPMSTEPPALLARTAPAEDPKASLGACELADEHRSGQLRYPSEYLAAYQGRYDSIRNTAKTMPRQTMEPELPPEAEPFRFPLCSRCRTHHPIDAPLQAVREFAKDASAIATIWESDDSGFYSGGMAYVHEILRARLRCLAGMFEQLAPFPHK